MTKKIRKTELRMQLEKMIKAAVSIVALIYLESILMDGFFGHCFTINFMVLATIESLLVLGIYIPVATIVILYKHNVLVNS